MNNQVHKVVHIVCDIVGQAPCTMTVVHHILKLVRHWEFPIAMLALGGHSQINYRPQKEMMAKLGDGQTMSSFTTL